MNFDSKMWRSKNGDSILQARFQTASPTPDCKPDPRPSIRSQMVMDVSSGFSKAYDVDSHHRVDGLSTNNLTKVDLLLSGMNERALTLFRMWSSHTFFCKITSCEFILRTQEAGGLSAVMHSLGSNWSWALLCDERLHDPISAQHSHCKGPTNSETEHVS